MHLPRFVVLSLLLGTAVNAAIQRLPVEDFARDESAGHATLAPDGRHMAFLREVQGRERAHVMDVATGAIVSINAGTAALVNDAQKAAAGVEWVSDRRLIITTAVWGMLYGVVAVDLDGRQGTPISGYEDENLKWSSESMRLLAIKMIHRVGDKAQSILMLDYTQPDHPDVIKLNTMDGGWSTEVKNPGNVVRWGVDNHGVVRFGEILEGEGAGAIYRENETAAWRRIKIVGEGPHRLHPLNFDAADNQIFVTALTAQKRWTLFRFDPVGGTLSAPLLEDPEYDIIPEHYIPDISGIPLNAPIFNGSGDRLLGIRYITDAPRIRWFDPGLARIQMAVDHTLPDTVNVLVGMSTDGKRMLWFGYSDKNPGVYLMLDLEKKSLKPIAHRMDWIKPAQMAPMLAIKYQARDGLTIHGFLTVPVGHEAKGLPLVVLPHGGPWTRDVWGFDPLVQWLANRGYAVLQMNYRGSPGYGQKLFRGARRQIGLQIQDDIEDATRWAIASGVADPKRIAICGGSYGGYSALFALGHNHDLYRCGISLAGVTDWSELYFHERRKDDSDLQEAGRHWRREIGDPEANPEFFRTISPVYFADKITAPVLILQGKQDRIVPPSQAKNMIKALTDAGHPPQSQFFNHMGHDYGDTGTRAQIFQLMADFLEKNLGPGVN